MDKLLPCPFCGNKCDVEMTKDPFFLGDYVVHCDQCGSVGPGAETSSDAIKAWNTRVENAKKETTVISKQLWDRIMKNQGYKETSFGVYGKSEKENDKNG